MIRIFMVGYSKNKGGVESYIMNLYGQLKNEYEFVFCWPEMELNGKKWVCPRNRHNFIKYYLFWRKFFKENHFDVIYYNTCDIVSIDMLKFAKKAGVNVRIIHSHNTGIQEAIDTKLNFFHKFTEKRNRKTLDKYATHFFACSKVAGKWMFDDRNFEIIENGIELNKYKFNLESRNECRKKLNLKNEILIGCVGRLDPQKNPFFAVDVFEKLLKKHPDATLVFIGDGALKTKLEKTVAERNLDKKVIFLGPRDDVNKWLSAIDCLIMPSLFEGLPFVLVEAQAAGVSCVVSSAVSEESNITGLVQFISLEESKEIWVDKLLEASKKEKAETAKILIENGYSVKESVDFVCKKIDTALGV